jgi:hypothetical protein
MAWYRHNFIFSSGVIEHYYLKKFSGDMVGETIETDPDI